MRYTPGAWIGPYQIVRELGRGGMGAVLEVRHPEIPRPLALKVVLAGELDAGQERRFAREAELLGQIGHPGVVRVHAVGRTPEGQPWLVTELVAGQDLDRVVRAAIPEPRRAAEIARDLADALAHVHARGIVHRDLKPANAILTPEGRPVLLDFGLARAEHLERLTRTGALLGTPAFMAPEQVEGSQVGPLADVYGLGAILFFLLTGRQPFAGGGVAVLKQVVVDEPTWPSEGIPKDLLAICRQAMSKKAEGRYESAAALRDDLERFLRAEEVSARPPVVTRSQVRLGLVVGAVSLLLVAALAAVWGVRRLVTPREPERPELPVIEREQPKTPARLLELALAEAGTKRRDALQGWLAEHSERAEAAKAREALARVGYDLPLAQLRHAEATRIPDTEQERDPRLVRGRFTGPREVVTWCGSELRFWSLPPGFGPAERARRIVVAPGSRPWLIRDVVPLPGGDLLAVLAEVYGGNRACLARLRVGGQGFELLEPELPAMWPWRLAVAALPDGAARIAVGGRAPAEPGASGLRRGRLVLLELASSGAVRLAYAELEEAPIASFLLSAEGGELIYGSGGTAESHEGAIIQAKNRILRLGWPAPGGAPVRDRDRREWESEQLPNAPTELLRLPGGDFVFGTHGSAIYRFGPALEHRDPDEVPSPVARDLADSAGGLAAIRFAHGGTIRGLALVGGRVLSISGDFGPERGPRNNELRWWRLPGFEEVEDLRRKALPEAPWWLDVAPDGQAFLLGFVDRVELRAVPPE